MGSNPIPSMLFMGLYILFINNEKKNIIELIRVRSDTSIMKLMRIHSLCLISTVTMIVISILPITATLSFYDKKPSNQLQNSILEQQPIKVQDLAHTI